MAEIKLNDINNAMDSFLKKADQVKIKKKELMDNMPQLLEAIKMFDRLKSLYESIQDRNSPRAKNYYSLAQQIASINEGWQNADSTVSREAFLADRDGAGYPNRLNKQESETLKRLMISSKLKNFVEYLDMDSPDRYEFFKNLVLSENENSKRANMPMRSWVSSRVSKYVGDVAASDLPKDSLVSQEERRQNRTKIDEAVSDIEKTTKAIEVTIRDKKDPEAKKDKVSVKTKSWKAPKGTWLGDLQQLLKWAGMLVGTVGAVAGASSLIAGEIRKAVDYQKELKSKLDDYIQDRRDNKERDEAALTDKEAAGAHMDKLLSRLKEEQILPENVTSDTITLFKSWAVNPETSKSLRKLMASIVGEDPRHLTILEAIARGQTTAVVPRTGTAGPSFNLVDVSVPDENMSSAQLYTRSVEAKRRQVALSMIYRPQWRTDYTTVDPSLPYANDINKGVVGANLLSWIRNKNAGVYGDLDIEQVNSMSTSDLESYALRVNQKRWEQSLLKGSINSIDYDPSYSVGVPVGSPGASLGAPDTAIGEIIYNSTKRGLAKLRQAQKSGDRRQVYEALKNTRGLGDNIGSYEDSQSMIDEVLSYRDWGTDEGFIQNSATRTKYYDPSGMRREAQTTINQVSQTHFNTYEVTESSQTHQY